ncbi:hypothetical protein FAZ15_02525 [Sphingobacterium olei]|uniref:Methane oxygenase PmoA n=2 Tax=Sphingobacterium olei TaxID=2571155 RepID=A0A4U0P6U8_9SPHI|nr:hypothetical protein FAZ15_02525 [Sphingobacterium olei]
MHLRPNNLIFLITVILWLLSYLCQAQVNGQSQNLQLVIDSMLTISKGKHRLLSYQFNTIYPPEGQDSSFQRSGFIHPLNTLKGHRLTRIQPNDHYHHYGIWNPWTHTLFEQDTVDFWNLKKKTGTVRFVRITNKDKGRNYAEYTALHHHVAFKKNGIEKVALEEWQTVRVEVPEESKDYYWVDITTTFRCASTSPLRLLTYRYGGLGWRATEFWDKNNCEVLTSEGNDRKNTDGSKARWCLVQGDLPNNSHGGMAVLSHPDNYNHPEPLRIWDESGNNGRGDFFLNVSPTKDRDWLLEPGHTYILKYRLIVFDGRMDADSVERTWQSFSKNQATHK